jgi:1-acyl-sn-glycerol-3-phosphate acyltransferase
MIRWIFAKLFKLSGWKFTGHIPEYLPKGIWAVCPHWSAWDFIIGIGAKSALSIDIGYLGKHTLFKWYWGWFFRGLGGFPVNRTKSHNLVEAVAHTFQSHDTIHIALAPEGTRKDVEKLKTGFYYIALAANVPIIAVCFDYANKAIDFGPVIYPTGNYSTDMKIYADYYCSKDIPRKAWLNNYINNGVI